MIKLLKNRKILLTLAVVLLLVFLNFFGSGNLRRVFYKVSSPLNNYFSRASQGIYNFFKLTFSIPRLSRENKKLREENFELSNEIIRLQELALENKFLKAQLNLEEKNEMELLMARVSSRDPQNLVNLVLINKGSKQKVRVGMPVVDKNKHLVGKIVEVFSNSSRLLLATDPTSRINGLLQSSRATGIVKGKYSLGLLMELIPQSEQVKIGDIVLTSGLASEFPQGIFIGKVGKIIESEADIFKKAWIKPAADFNHLERVFVVLEY